MTQKQFILLSAALTIGLGQPAARAQSALHPDSVITLPAVEVNEKHLSRFSAGEIKKLQVDKDLTSVTGTAAEAFRQLPSLVADIEGNLLFRGSPKSSVLINGIPYGMMEENSGDVLIQLPALFFNSLSLSSVPGTEYIPDGSGSVLSLSSSAQPETSPLQLNLGAGWHERYNAGMQLHLRPGKFQVTARYNYRREFRDRTFRKTTTTTAGTKTMDNSASARPDVHIADLSVAYDLSPKDILSVYGLYHLMDYSRYGGIHVTNELSSGKVNKMLRHRYNDQRQEAYAAEARWSHLFSSPQEQLDVTFNYNNFAYDEDNHFENENPKGDIVKQDNSFINQDKHQYYLSADYRKTFAPELFFKGGYIGRLVDDQYTATAEDLKQGAWTPNPASSTDFSFHRVTNLLYASLHARIKRFNLEAGLQAEHTWQEAKNKAQGRLTDDSYFRLYPQARLSYHDHAGGTWLLSYTQRIDRPTSKELNPFIDRSNDIQVVQGNPELKPEMLHLVELSYTYAGDYFRLVPAAYCRYRTDRIMDVAQTNGADVIWHKENVGNSQAAGVELAAYWYPARFLTVGASGNIFWDQINGKLIGYETDKSMSCWDVKGDIKFSLTPTTELQIDGFYVSDQLTTQGKIKSHYAVNAGASQYLMHRKLRINLSVNNLFDSLKEVTVIDTPGLQLHQERNRDARVAWLSLNYML